MLFLNSMPTGEKQLVHCTVGTTVAEYPDDENIIDAEFVDVDGTLVENNETRCRRGLAARAIRAYESVMNGGK